MEARIRLAVLLGGALGSAGRVGLGAALATATVVVPAATLVVNVTGTAALAVLGRRLVDPVARAMVLTGAIGAWTTVSGLAVETVALGDTGGALRATGYLVVTLGSGLLATFVGSAAGRTRTPDSRIAGRGRS